MSLRLVRPAGVGQTQQRAKDYVGILVNGSRVCDTNRAALELIDVSHTLTDNNDIIILALGLDTAGGDELRVGLSNTWQFRTGAAVFATLVTGSGAVRLADSVALVDTERPTDAERRGNTGGTYIQSGREHETTNPQDWFDRVRNGDLTETQCAVSFANAATNTEYEFRCVVQAKNATHNLLLVAKVTTAAVAAPALPPFLLERRRVANIPLVVRT